MVGTAPFVARQVESALLNVDPGVIEAAKAMGSTPFEIIYRVLLREGLGGIIYGLTITTVNQLDLAHCWKCRWWRSIQESSLFVMGISTI